MKRLVGLIPAAGLGTRLGLTGSKELAPVAASEGTGEAGGPLERRPVATTLLDALGAARIETAYVVLRTGKWDVPEGLGDRGDAMPRLAYIVTEPTRSIPETLNRARRFVLGAQVMLGFPDVVFSPRDAVLELLAARERLTTDVVLALFPSERPDKTDMVQLDGDRVTGFRIKPGPCVLEYTWILATWGDAFTEFLSAFLGRTGGEPPAGSVLPELQISQVLDAALEEGLTIGACPLPQGRFIDVGTPDDLARAREGAL
ncbi:MAG: NDP-sugar synthase [Thermoanaerobaculia bacterium]